MWRAQHRGGLALPVTHNRGTLSCGSTTVYRCVPLGAPAGTRPVPSAHLSGCPDPISAAARIVGVKLAQRRFYCPMGPAPNLTISHNVNVPSRHIALVVPLW